MKKPGQPVRADATIVINDEACGYVSRAALKLLHAFKVSGYNVEGKTCLDIGASTGGFTQVLLERGALRVFGVDVGHGQLDDLLANDPRVINLYGLNARDLEISHLEDCHPEFVVSDVSFISLKLALPRTLDMAAPGAKGIFLVKPQFEVGRKFIGRNGLVCDEEVGLKAAIAIRDWLGQQAGWKVEFFTPSPIRGGNGNLEYIVAAEKPV